MTDATSELNLAKERPESDEPQADISFDSGELRLRARLRWAPWCVALITLLPYEVVGGSPLFFWNLIGELPIGGIVACLAPLLTAVVLSLVAYKTRRPSTLALSVLGAAAALVLLVKLGADASAWEIVGLPDSIGRRIGPPLVILALTSAGASLTFRSHSRRVGGITLIAAVVLMLAFYLWPGRGEAPGRTLWRMVASLSDLPHWRYMIGHGLIALLVAWPAVISLTGLQHLRWPARDDQPVISIAALYGLPLMLVMMVMRALPDGPKGWDIFTALGGVAVFIGSVSLLSSAFEVWIAHTFAPEADYVPPAGLAPRRAAAVVAGTLVILVGAQFALTRPPAKGVAWKLGAATEAGDALFGELLPSWNRQRLAWDGQAKTGSAAEALIELKSRGNDAVQAAEAIDPGLGLAVKALVSNIRDLSVTARAWSEALEGVNAATRAAGLPYYLDPSVRVSKAEGELEREFRIRSFRVSRVRPFNVDGEVFTTLHVERLDRMERGIHLLGFSRDHQPYALINLVELRGFTERLQEQADEIPPSCGDHGGFFAMPALQTCGVVLGQLVSAVGNDPEGLLPLAATLTDRHELQHQIDGPHLALAGALLEVFSGYRSPAFLERANRELSAYTAEFTAPDSKAHLGLVHLVPFAVADRGDHLEAVATLALTEMARPEIGDAEAFLSNRSPNLATVTKAVNALAALDDATLKSRAADAWHTFYGASLPTVSPAEIP